TAGNLVIRNESEEEVDLSHTSLSDGVSTFRMPPRSVILPKAEITLSVLTTGLWHPEQAFFVDAAGSVRIASNPPPTTFTSSVSVSPLDTKEQEDEGRSTTTVPETGAGEESADLPPAPESNYPLLPFFGLGA